MGRGERGESAGGRERARVGGGETGECGWEGECVRAAVSVGRLLRVPVGVTLFISLCLCKVPPFSPQFPSVGNRF